MMCVLDFRVLFSAMYFAMLLSRGVSLFVPTRTPICCFGIGIPSLYQVIPVCENEFFPPYLYLLLFWQTIRLYSRKHKLVLDDFYSTVIHVTGFERAK